MSISAVNFGNNTVNQQVKTVQNNTQKPQTTSLRNECAKEGIELPKPTPLQAGLLNGAIWFGAGLGIERLTSTMFKSMKSSLKVSLIMNAAVGLFAGVSAYLGTKKEAQQEQQAQKIS